MAADAVPLARRIERARRGARAGGRVGTDRRRRSRARSSAGEARAARRPAIDYPPELPVAQRADEHRADDPRPSGRHRLRRNGLGQDHAAAEDLPRRSGRGERGLIGHTQPRRIAARAVATRIAQELGTEPGDGRRLQGPLHRPHEARRVRQADDGRHPARRDAGRSAARRLRHDHHRRGARAQPQHRFPAGLPEAAPAEAARSQGDHHVGDARCRALRAALRHRRDAGAGHRSVRPHVSGRSALPAARSARATTRPTTRRSSRTRSSTRSRTSGAAVRATSSCSCPASARSARRPRC